MQQKQIYDENLQEVQIGALLWKQLFRVFCNPKGNSSWFEKATWTVTTIAAFLAWTQGWNLTGSPCYKSEIWVLKSSEKSDWDRRRPAVIYICFWSSACLCRLHLKSAFDRPWLLLFWKRWCHHNRVATADADGNEQRGAILFLSRACGTLRHWSTRRAFTCCRSRFCRAQSGGSGWLKQASDDLEDRECLTCRQVNI